MSDGRTYYWKCDAAWYDRERVADLTLMYGPTGAAALHWLCCHAKALNDGGIVKTGYSAVAKGIGGKVDEVAAAVRYAAEIGALDDFAEDGKRFTARISGWEADQDRLDHVERQTRYRERVKAGQTVTPRDAGVTRGDEERESSRRETTTSLRSVVDARWDPVLSRLVVVAIAKGCEVPEAAKLVSYCERYADRDHVAEAEAFNLYYVDGAGENRRIKSLSQTWGNWLQRAPSAAKRNAPRGRNKKISHVEDSFPNEAEQAAQLAAMEDRVAGRTVRRAGSETSDPTFESHTDAEAREHNAAIPR